MFNKKFLFNRNYFAVNPKTVFVTVPQSDCKSFSLINSVKFLLFS